VVSFWSGLFIGAALGAIASVAADRAWRKVELRPRIRARFGHFKKVAGISGGRYTIQNIGAAVMQDYEIWLYHPQRGRYNPFEESVIGVLHPGQKRTHEMIQFKEGKQIPTNWFHSCDGKTTTEPVFDDFEFLIQMKDSDNVLYRNKTMGNAFARQCVDAIRHGRDGEWTYGEQQQLDTPRATKWGKRWTRIAVFLGLRQQPTWEEDVECAE